MKAPLQITFRNMQPSPAVEEWIFAAAEKLETAYPRIMRCHIVVDAPHQHRVKGVLYHVSIDLRVPGGELVIKRAPNPRNQARQAGTGKVAKDLEIDAPRKDLRLAIDAAFRTAGRRLQDYARRQSGRVKAHETVLKAHVAKIFPGSYGFLTTEDGREIYFHKQSVLSPGFSRLRVGTPVTFVDEQGEEGTQASTVRIIGTIPSRARAKAATNTSRR